MSTASTADKMRAAAEVAGLLSEDGRVHLQRPIRNVLRNVDLSIVDFYGATFSGTRFINCPAPGATFTDCKFDACFFAAEGTGLASLRGAKFINCSLTGTDFGAARLDLREIEFEHTLLRNCTFRFGRLAQARFHSCYLDYVMLRAADLDGVSFAGSILKKVCFERTDLSAVSFENVTFQQADFWGRLNIPDFN